MAMFKRWIRFRRFFRMYVYVFLLCCGLTVVMLSNIEIENYQVQLTEEIKVEIDLSAPIGGVPGSVPMLTGRTLSETTKKLDHKYWSLEEEEWRNKLSLFQFKNSEVHNESRKNISNSATNHTKSACLGVPASQEFVFHKITGTVHIYSAYWDSRWNDFDNKKNGTYIRMFGYAKQKDEQGEKARHKLSCLFFIQGAYHIVPAADYLMSDDHGRTHASYIFSCQVPSAVTSVVCSVLVAQGEVADPKWATRIPVRDTAAHEERFSIAQCVPPLFGAISDHRLVEFVEMSKILGSQHMTVYVTDEVRMDQALEYYKRTGFLSVIPWPLPPKNSIWYFGQMMAIQDCLYRNMPVSEWVIFNDIDEHIIPTVYKTWMDLIKVIDQDNQHVALAVQSAFFRSAEPANTGASQLTIERDTVMTATISKIRDKCFVRPQHIFEKGIHHVSKPMNARKGTFRLPVNVALLHHYRKCSKQYGQICTLEVKNDRALGYVEELKKRMQFTKEWMKKLVT